MLLVRVRVADDEIGGDGIAAGSRRDQVVHRPHQLLRINLAPGSALPIISAGLEAEKETLKAGFHHQLGQRGSEEASV